MGAAKSNDYLKECIADAIIVLIKEKPIEKISIDEIVKKAGVGRATYFRSFSSKNEASTFLNTIILYGTFSKLSIRRASKRQSTSLFTESC